MECPNCGLQNSVTSSYCSACAAPLIGSKEAAGNRLKPAEIVSSVLWWFAGIVLSIILVFFILTLTATAIVALYDLFAGHGLLAGLGYVFAAEGALIAVVTAFGLFGIPDKIVITRGRNIPPAVFYNTVFSPVMSAMRSTPRTYYDHSLVLAIASFLVFLLGLVLLG